MIRYYKNHSVYIEYWYIFRLRAKIILLETFQSLVGPRRKYCLLYTNKESVDL